MLISLAGRALAEDIPDTTIPKYGIAGTGNLPDFIAKLWKRRVVQFAVLYLGSAWLIQQVTAQLEATLELPNWLNQFVVAILALGFPIAIIFAWVRERMASREDSETVIAPDTVGAIAREAEFLKGVLPFDSLPLYLSSVDKGQAEKQGSNQFDKTPRRNDRIH